MDGRPWELGGRLEGPEHQRKPGAQRWERRRRWNRSVSIEGCRLEKGLLPSGQECEDCDLHGDCWMLEVFASVWKMREDESCGVDFRSKVVSSLYLNLNMLN
jgi:hypothetical protein